MGLQSGFSLGLLRDVQGIIGNFPSMAWCEEADTQILLTGS